MKLPELPSADVGNARTFGLAWTADSMRAYAKEARKPLEALLLEAADMLESDDRGADLHEADKLAVRIRSARDSA